MGYEGKSSHHEARIAFAFPKCQHSTPAGPPQVKRKTRKYSGNWCPRGDSNTRWQFRKPLAVSEVLDISTAPSGLAGPRRAWTAAAASETGGRSAVCEGKGFEDPDPRFLANLRDAILRNAAKRGRPRPTASHIFGGDPHQDFG